MYDVNATHWVVFRGRDGDICVIGSWLDARVEDIHGYGFEELV